MSTPAAPPVAWNRLGVAFGFVGPAFALELAAPRLVRAYGEIVSAAVAALVAVGVGLALYAWYVRRFERRTPSELDRSKAAAELALGFLLGAAMFAAAIGVLGAFGLYRISGRRDWAIVVAPLLASIGTGIMEELVFRGVVFRIVENRLGTWASLGVSAALFGLLHLVNPQATVQGAVAIVFEAGILLAAAYVLTRRLWLPIGLHVGWNFTQGGLFGVPVSGFRAHGLFDGRLDGPEWLSGGAFGAEASIVAVVLGIAVGTAMLAVAHRRGHFLAPAWRRPDAALPRSPA